MEVGVANLKAIKATKDEKTAFQPDTFQTRDSHHDTAQH
jgi:hypothetical protein